MISNEFREHARDELFEKTIVSMSFILELSDEELENKFIYYFIRRKKLTLTIRSICEMMQ